MRRAALLLLFALPILAQQRNPLTRGLADMLYVKLAGSDTVLGTVTFTNLVVTGMCTGCSGAGAGTGDFSGPGAATDNAIVRFDMATGKLGQNSVVIVDDSGNITGVSQLAAHAASDVPTLTLKRNATAQTSNLVEFQTQAGLLLSAVDKVGTFVGAVIGDVTGNLTGNVTGNVTGNTSGSSGSTTGNAATATALAANGTNCSAANAPLGVDASGNSEGCFGITLSSVVPNTAPSAGQLPVGNAGNTAYAPQSVSGDCTLASTGAITCTKTNGSSFVATATSTDAANLSGSLAAARMPALTGDATTSAGAVATTLATVNSNVGSFTNSNITVNGKGLVTAASSGTAAPTIPTTAAMLKGDGSGNASATALTESSGAIATTAGTALSVTATAPTQTASAQAGVSASFGASGATAGSSNAGAAAGGFTRVFANNAARLTSGNAGGGWVNLEFGTGIGTGTSGFVTFYPNGYASGAIGTPTQPAWQIGCTGTNCATGGSAGWFLTTNSDWSLSTSPSAASSIVFARNSSGLGGIGAGSIVLPSTGCFAFGSGALVNSTAVEQNVTDTFACRGAAAATLQLGGADASTSVAQILQGQGRTGADAAGSNLTIRSGNGTGTGGSGDLLLQTALPGSTSSTADTFATVARVRAAGAHMEYTGTAPSLSSCGVSPSVAGNDNVMRVTIGTGAQTTCTVTFAKAWSNAPTCVTSDASNVLAVEAGTTTTVLTLTSLTSMGGDAVNVQCFGYF